MLTAGVDEAGRGPLVGDVVAAAVILPEDFVLQDVKDSKKLSETARERLYPIISEMAVSWAIGTASPREIDEINILRAALLAMQRAVENLSVKPQKVFVDGNMCPNISIDCEAIVKGDTKVLSISAASIMAKVYRDRQMYELDKKYPAYGFAAHKGYPTKDHMLALAKFGPVAEHRATFGPVARYLSVKQ